MSDRIRRLLIMIMTGLIIVFVLGLFRDVQTVGRDSMQYYLESFPGDTGAVNGVAAIYLDYRVFDTFMEALLLMISVTGIIYFLEEKGHGDTE